MNVLVVEDDNLPRKVLVRTLEGWGYQVQQARDGNEAWDLFQQEPTGFVVSDWMMPGLDGLQLCKCIKDAERLPFAYFVLLTAKADKVSLVEALENGADDFLSKPFDPQELRARLRAGERILRLATELADKLTEVALLNHRTQRLNQQMALGVRRLLDSITNWSALPYVNGRALADPATLKKQMKQELESLICTWAEELTVQSD